MVLLRARAQKKGRKKGKRSPESKSERETRWERLEMEDGQHMAVILQGMETKCCCLTEGKEHEERGQVGQHWIEAQLFQYI